jgi:hypothetical protein
MTEMPRLGFVDVILFLVLVAAAGGLRAGYLHGCADDAHTSGPLLVQGEDPDQPLALAAGLRDNWTFATRAPLGPGVENTCHTAPGYPWLLGLLGRLPLDLDWTVRWLQCGLGALTAGLYFFFARRAFRSRVVGVLAGVLCAIHPYYVINTAELNDGVVASFLLAACLLLGARAGESGGAFTSLLYGLALAAAALVRPAWLPFGFVALLWFLLRCRKLPRGWFVALLAFLGFANGLAPWTLRNFQVLQDVVPIVDSTYYHLWMGNNPRATGGPQNEQALIEALAAQRGQEPAAVTSHLAELKQQERYHDLAGDVVAEVMGNPLGTVQRRLWAGLYFFFGESWFKEQRLWQVRQPPPPPADDPDPQPPERLPMPEWLEPTYPLLLTGTLLGMLTLGVLGWRWTYGWRVESMPAALAVAWIVLPYLLSHAEALNGPRLPLDGLLLTYAAFALACLIPGVSRTLLRGGEG